MAIPRVKINKYLNTNLIFLILSLRILYDKQLSILNIFFRHLALTVLTVVHAVSGLYVYDCPKWPEKLGHCAQHPVSVHNDRFPTWAYTYDDVLWHVLAAAYPGKTSISSTKGAWGKSV